MTKTFFASAFSLLGFPLWAQQNPLAIPTLLQGNTFDLTIQTGTQEFFTGITTPTYGFNGDILGPTLLMDKGDWVTINVHNTLNTSTTVHWHGLHVPAMMDGGPHQIINAGATWSPQFEVKNDAALYWYHPHGEHKTDLHVSKGLAGLIIIKDSVESALSLPRTYGIDDVPLVLQTKAFDELQQVAIASQLDSVVMVNATQNAYHNFPAQVVRLRVLNGSSQRTYNLGFSNGITFYQIGVDAGLLGEPVPLTRLWLSPGERTELLLDLAALQNDTFALMSYGSELPNGIMGSPFVGNGMASLTDYDLNPLNGADFQLLELRVVAPTPNAVTSIPTTLVPQTPWQTADADEIRTLAFEPQVMNPVNMVEGPFTINGELFDMEVINITTYLDNIEVWVLENMTSLAHPFHLHDVPFYIIEVAGNPPPAHLQGKKDVVLVRPQETVKFITKFENFADTMPYMYHCHLLHHEDDGMMGQFVVLDTTVSLKPLPSPQIKFFPNPFNSHVLVENIGGGNIEKLVLIDVLGQVLHSETPFAPKLNLALPHLPTGLYWLQVQCPQGIYTQPLIKE